MTTTEHSTTVFPDDLPAEGQFPNLPAPNPLVLPGNRIPTGVRLGTVVPPMEPGYEGTMNPIPPVPLSDRSSEDLEVLRLCWDESSPYPKRDIEKALRDRSRTDATNSSATETTRSMPKWAAIPPEPSTEMPRTEDPRAWLTEIRLREEAAHDTIDEQLAAERDKAKTIKAGRDTAARRVLAEAEIINQEADEQAKALLLAAEETGRILQLEVVSTAEQAKAKLREDILQKKLTETLRAYYIERIENLEQDLADAQLQAAVKRILAKEEAEPLLAEAAQLSIKAKAEAARIRAAAEKEYRQLINEAEARAANDHKDVTKRHEKARARVLAGGGIDEPEETSVRGGNKVSQRVTKLGGLIALPSRLERNKNQPVSDADRVNAERKHPRLVAAIAVLALLGGGTAVATSMVQESSQGSTEAGETSTDPERNHVIPEWAAETPSLNPWGDRVVSALNDPRIAAKVGDVVYNTVAENGILRGVDTALAYAAVTTAGDPAYNGGSVLNVDPATLEDAATKLGLTVEERNEDPYMAGIYTGLHRMNIESGNLLSNPDKKAIYDKEMAETGSSPTFRADLAAVLISEVPLQQLFVDMSSGDNALAQTAIQTLRERWKQEYETAEANLKDIGMLPK